jgi:hypothetical protein
LEKPAASIFRIEEQAECGGKRVYLPLPTFVLLFFMLGLLFYSEDGDSSFSDMLLTIYKTAWRHILKGRNV